MDHAGARSPELEWLARASKAQTPLDATLPELLSAPQRVWSASQAGRSGGGGGRTTIPLTLTLPGSSPRVPIRTGDRNSIDQ